MAWMELIDQEQFSNEVLKKGEVRHVVFKHSPRCGISSMVLRRFEKSDFFQTSKDQMWLLDVVKSRDLSTQIAQNINVRHESPQVLVFSDGKVIHHDSHSGIDGDTLISLSK